MTRPSYSPPGHPIGYVEVQGAYTGPFDHDKGLELFGEIMKRAASEHPGLVVVNARWETTVDGAGLEQQHLYMGFAPRAPSSEPLDPHNMNEAPPPQVGMPDPTDGIVPLGVRETKF